MRPQSNALRNNAPMLEDHLKPRVALWKHIALGVCIGTLTASAIQYGAGLWLASIEAQRAEAEAKRMVQKALDADGAQRRASAQADAAKREADTERQRREAEAEATRVAEADRRELAWTRFYKKPAACDEGRGGAWTVECANDYIRARKRFAAEYDAGKI